MNEWLAWCLRPTQSASSTLAPWDRNNSTILESPLEEAIPIGDDPVYFTRTWCFNLGGAQIKHRGCHHGFGVNVCSNRYQILRNFNISVRCGCQQGRKKDIIYFFQSPKVSFQFVWNNLHTQIVSMEVNTATCWLSKMKKQRFEIVE